MSRHAASRSEEHRRTGSGESVSGVRSVAEILERPATLEISGSDRMYLNAFVPRLQTDVGVAAFLVKHRGNRFASSVLMDPISKAFIETLESFARDRNLNIVSFEKGQRKDDLAAGYRKRFVGPEGVLFIGKAQEKARVFRTQKRRNPQTGATYPWLVPSTAMVKQFKDLREPPARLLGLRPDQLSAGRMTYDLRRLSLHGLLERIPKTHRYRLTPAGLRVAVFFNRVYGRLLRPTLSALSHQAPPGNNAIRAAFRHLEARIDQATAVLRLAA